MDYSAAVDYINKFDDFILVTHINPDGDTLGSAAALCSALRRAGKTAWLFNTPDIPEKYAEYVEKYIAPKDYAFKKVISVDVASESLVPDGIDADVDLVIDHHPGNSFKTDNKLARPRYSSCGEIVYRLILKLHDDVTDEEALLLYIAISTDTGCFQYYNTNYNTLETVSRLYKHDIDTGGVNRKLFRKVSRARIMLEGMIYSGMKYFKDGRISVAIITRKMAEDCGATVNDLDDIASLACRPEGVSLGITIREQADGKCKVSMRSFDGINSREICSVCGGGGHESAAGCTISALPAQAISSSAPRATSARFFVRV